MYWLIPIHISLLSALCVCFIYTKVQIVATEIWRGFSKFSRSLNVWQNIFLLIYSCFNVNSVICGRPIQIEQAGVYINMYRSLAINRFQWLIDKYLYYNQDTRTKMFAIAYYLDNIDSDAHGHATSDLRHWRIYSNGNYSSIIDNVVLLSKFHCF